MLNDSINNISGGNNQFLPNAVKSGQHYHYEMMQPPQYPVAIQPVGNETVIVLGAGYDSALGMPSSQSLIPKIVDYLQTDEGKMVDAQLRKNLKRLNFSFDKFVSNAIDRLARDLDPELETICRNIKTELDSNPELTEETRKTGNLIFRIFKKILDVKAGAAIDEETEALIQEVFGTDVKDDSIIDFTKIPYTETFKVIVISILQRSMRENENPILRHVYRNLLDIEKLLAQYFYGFYSGKDTYIKTYLYISWMMWAYLVHEEQRVREKIANQSVSTPSLSTILQEHHCGVISFNYTSFAREACSDALYFHGSLFDYVDIENKNVFNFDNITEIDLEDFFTNRLPEELCLSGDRRAIPIPSFLPPLRLKPVISKDYITTWYKSGEMLRSANRIILLGYSFVNPDDYFCDMLRDNRDAHIIIINKDVEGVAKNVCRVFQLSPSRYSRQTTDGIEHRTYNNRIEIIGENLSSFDLSKYLS